MCVYDCIHTYLYIYMRERDKPYIRMLSNSNILPNFQYNQILEIFLSWYYAG